MNVLETAKKAQTGEEKAAPPRAESAPEVQSVAQNIVANEGPEVTAKMAKLYFADQSAYQQILEGMVATYGPAAADLLHADVMDRVGRVAEREAAGGEKPDIPLDVEATDVAEQIVNRLQGPQSNVDKQEEEQAKNAPPEEKEIPPEQKAAEQNIIDENESRAEQTAALLNNLGPKIGVDPSKVPIKADQEAKGAAEAYGAAGLIMAKDSPVYLHPDEYNPGTKEGQQLLGEEVAHWAQMHNALAGGGSEVTAKPAAETEAKQIASDFASGRTPAPPQETISQGAIAADVGEAGPPSKVVLNFGGASVEVALPASTEPRVVVRNIPSPITGLTLGDATLEFDSNWQITGGSVKAGCTIGSFVTVTDATLQISAGGGVACDIRNVDLRVGDWGAGSIDLTLSPDGIRGSATFTSEQVTIGMGIVLVSGLVRISLDNQGKISGVGNLTGDIPGVGAITINAAAENETLGGTVSFVRSDPLQLAGGVILNSAVLSGNFTKQMFVVTGEADINVNGWVQGKIQGTYEHPTRTWSAVGTLTQIQPLVVGDATITEGQIGVKMDNGNLTEVAGGGKFAIPNWTGSLGGTYDVGANEFSGKAQAQLIQEIPLGGSGAILKSVNGEALLEANKLIEIKAGAVVEIPFQGQPTFKVEASACSYLVQEGTFSGTGTVSTKRDLTFGSPGGVQAIVKAGASAQGKVTDNALESIEGQLNYKVLDAGGELGGGALALTFAGSEVSGSGDFTLSVNYGFPDRAQGPVLIKQGSGVKVTIANSQPTQLDLNNVGFTVQNLGETGGKIDGTLQGSVNIQSMEASGSIQASLTSEWAIAADWGRFVFVPGGSVSGEVTANSLASLALNIPFKVEVNGEIPVKVDGNLNGTYNGEGKKVSGRLTGSLNEAVTIPMNGGADQVIIDAGGQASAQVTDNALESVKVDATAKYLRGGQLFLEGGITNGQYDVKSSKLSFTSNLQLKTDISKTSDDGAWTFKVKSGSEVTAKVSENNLDELGGNISFGIDDSEGPLFDGQLSEAKLDVKQMKFSGNLGVKMSRDISFPKSGGAEVAPGVEITVKQGSGVNGQMTDNKLDQVSADLEFGIKLNGQEFAAGTVSGDWNLTEDKFSGGGQVNLVADYDVSLSQGGGEGMAGWSLVFCTGSGLELAVANNQLQQAAIQVQLKLKNGGEEVATGTANGQYKLGDPAGYSGGITFQVTKDISLVSGSTFSIFLSTETKADAQVQGSSISSASGTLGVRVDKGTPLAKATLTGTYTPSGGVSGSGSAELLNEFNVGGPIGAYQLVVDKGTGAEITLEANEITQIGATINVRIDESGAPFIKGGLQGTLDYKAMMFSGTGGAEVVNDKQLVDVAGIKLWLCKGAGAEATVANNTLQQVGGSIKLRIDDAEGPFISVNLAGTFDAAGGTGFTGSGGATVTRDKKLFGVSGYEFWLATGAGATAEIKQNALEKVTGTVPFMVKDGQAEPLITGAANGEYIAQTGKFSGTGDVRLGRDIEIGLGGTSKIFFKKGSGGNGEVKDSELKKLGGTLNCELHTDGRPLVSINAEGEFDAVAKKLVRAEGSATLLRPFELLGGNVIVEGVTGSATIVDNKLVKAGGEGTIKVPPLNNMTGNFKVNWRNDGGKDVYSGSGKINFTLNDKMGGSIDAEYNEDDTFRVHGEIDYKINEMLKGKVGVEVTQDLDPVLNGELKIEGVELVPGQDLFCFEFPIVPGMNFGPYYGINIKVGADAGLKAAMQPLTLTTSIKVEDFHPLGEAAMPTFTVRADLNTGLTFEAAAKPYVGVTLGAQGLEAGVAVEGEVRLTVPVNINPYAELKGGPEGFNGKLGIGVSIVPQVDLFVRPYLFAALGSEEARKDLAEWQIPLGELFKWEWAKEYKWGDQGEGADAGPAGAVEAPAGGTQNQVKQETEGVEGFAGGGGGGQQSPDGPKLESPSEREGEQKGSQGAGPMGEMQSKFDEISKMAEKVANVAYLLSIVMDIVSVAMMSGGAAAAATVPVYLAYRVFVVGDITLEKIKKAVLDLVSLLQQGFDWIMANLPDWWQDVVAWVQSADPMGALKNATEWLTNNLKALGQEAIDFLKDAGGWGKDIINGAGEWAMEAAGWAMEVLSDVGEGIANAASSAWDAVSSLW